MKVYTAHTRPGAAPVLVPEGFSWGALFFGPLWLFAHRSWIPGLLLLCAVILVGFVPAPPLRPVLSIGLAWAAGLFGQEWRRWSLDRRGYVMAHVVAAGDRDGALSRLLDRRPDLIPDAVR